MPKKANNEKVKLVLRIEPPQNDKIIEIVINGANNIAYILDEAGLLDDELTKLLGYD